MTAKEHITIEDLAGETIFMPEEDPCFIPSVKKSLLRNNIPVTIRSLQSYQVLIPFIEMNQGVSFTTLQFPVKDSIRILPIDLHESIRIAVCVSKANPSPAVALHVKTIQKHFENYPSQMFKPDFS